MRIAKEAKSCLIKFLNFLFLSNRDDQASKSHSQLISILFLFLLLLLLPLSCPLPLVDEQVVNLDNNNGYEMIEKVLPSQSLIQNILKIEKPKDKDFGAYNCSVWNEYGYDNQTIILVKQSKIRLWSLLFPQMIMLI